MKKILLLILVVLSVVLAFSACKKNCPHKNQYVKDEVYADCTNEGTKDIYCERCQEFLRTETTPAQGHRYTDWEVLRESSCIENGEDIRGCTNCTYAEYRDRELIDHEFSDWEYSVSPDCSDSGIESRSCYSCNTTEERYADPLGHNPSSEAVKENEIPATCFSTGSYDMVIYCLDCSEDIERTSHTIPKAEHTAGTAVEENRVNPTHDTDGSYDLVVYCAVSECHAELERTKHTLDMLVHHPGTAVIENKVEATCERVGSYDEVVYCLDEDCGHKELSRKTIYLDPTPHTNSTPVTENTVAASCTASGSYDEVVYCQTCGIELSRTKITTPKANHTSSDAVTENLKEATCTENGSYDAVVYCSVCNTELSRNKNTTPSLGHTATSAVEENRTEASCKKEGSYEMVVYCSVCHDEMSRERVTIPTTDHSPSNAVVENEVEASCASRGSYDEVVYCSICGTELSRNNIETDLAPHTPGEVVTENRVEPSCAKEGSYDNVIYCSVCNTELQRDTVTIGSTQSHSYNGNECTVCGDLLDSVGLSFALSSDGSYYSLVGRGECADINIVVPSTYNGRAVKNIASEAFLNDTKLKSISIPNSVTTIGLGALKGCSSIESVSVPFVGDAPTGATRSFFGYIFSAPNTFYDNDDYIPASLKSVTVTGECEIASYAFYICNGLTNITISDNVTSIGEYAFANCTSLEKITLPFAGKTLTSGTLSDIFGIDGFKLPTTLKNIVITGGSLRGYDFSDFKYIEQVILPAGLTKIPEYTFQNCTNLKSVNIPDTVTSISSGAFHSCQSLESIVLPESLTTISSLAFYGCTGLKTLYIPKNVTSIAERAFYNCTGLEQYAVSEQNSAYKSVGGNIYSKDGETFVVYAIGKKDTGFAIPDSVKTVTYGAFYNCTNLTSITVPFVGETSTGSTLAQHFGYIFGVENKELPTTLKSVNVRGFMGSQAFYQCHSITEINLENRQISTIPTSAFANCSSLERVILYDHTDTIEVSAFKDCSSLKEIALPDGLSTIGTYAFKGCSSLTSVVVPNSVMSIGEEAFCKCTSLESITLPFVGGGLGSDSPSHFGYIFGASDYSSNASYVPTSLKEVVISGRHYHSMTEGNGCMIRTYAFYGCKNIQSVTVENASIANNAFQNCTGLRTITIGKFTSDLSNEWYTSIDKNAFQGCSALKTVIFGNFDNSKAPGYSLNIMSNIFNDSGANITDVYYAGTESEWKSVNIVQTGNEALTNAQIHYNYKPEE